MTYIFLSMIFFTSVIIVGAFASRSTLNVNIIVAIENAISALIPVLLAIPFIGKLSVQNQKLGIFAAILEGVLITLYVYMPTKSYALNKVAFVAPIVFGGGIFLSAVISYFLFKEKITPLQGIGLSILAVGLIIITYARLTGK